MPACRPIGRAVVIMTLVVGMTQGCSVGMALSGDENPDLSVIKVGASRTEVESQLGKPVKSLPPDVSGSKVDVFEYQIGDQSSGARALGHLGMDLLTFGIWELAGTTVEATQGTDYEAHIWYSEEDLVTKIKTRRIGSNY